MHYVVSTNKMMNFLEVRRLSNYVNIYEHKEFRIRGGRLLTDAIQSDKLIGSLESSMVGLELEVLM